MDLKNNKDQKKNLVNTKDTYIILHVLYQNI